MPDHVGLRVSDYARSKRFYERALAPLGYPTSGRSATDE
jgi:catechol 2,3-dioxygenase-like lactoylglutathione lyase family enzyme